MNEILTIDEVIQGFAMKKIIVSASVICKLKRGYHLLKFLKSTLIAHSHASSCFYCFTWKKSFEGKNTEVGGPSVINEE